jgi:tetratricopeptide (TPR) repeat protein
MQGHVQLSCALLLLAGMFSPLQASAKEQTKIYESLRPDFVLLRTSGAAESSVLRKLRAALQKDPRNETLAVQYVEQCLRLQEQTADDRLPALAMSALGPWWTESTAPIRIRLFKAILLQRRHDFAGAQRELEELLQIRPNDSEILRFRCAIFLVQGKYEQARSLSFRLLQTGSSPFTFALLANLASLSGNTDSAVALLAKQLQAVENKYPAEETAAAFSTLGELCERSGNYEQAAEAHAKALTLQPLNLFYRAALADCHLRAGKVGEVIPLLRTRTDIPMMLQLRYVEALKQMEHPDFPAERLKLRQYFSLLREEGNTIHQRELARYLSRIEGDHAKAFEAARNNWNLQKEPVDAELLLEAAQGAKQLNRADEVTGWILKHRWSWLQLPTEISAQVSR